MSRSLRAVAYAVWALTYRDALTLHARARRVLALASLLGVPAIATAQSITLRADSARRTIAPSSKLAVPVILDMSAAGGANLASLAAGVAFDASRLTFDSVRTAGFGSLTSNTASAGSGALTLGVFDATGTMASQTIATMYFTASATMGGTTIAFTPTAAGSDVGVGILALLRTRALDVCVALSGKWGDVNGDSVSAPLGDGVVNIIDAQQVARYSVGLPVANRPGLVVRGDVTADATVNIIDAQQVARFSVGMSASARINASVFTLQAVVSIGLTPSITQSLAIGQSVRISATSRDATSADLTGCTGVTWSSSNPTVATIGADGTVRGVANGTVTIRATSTENVGVTASLAVVVGTGSLGVGFDIEQFALVPAGTFLMGSAAGNANETPVHAVTISRTFYLQRTEVTQGQWRSVMGSNPSLFPACGDACPVEQVSWNDIQTFIQQLNAQNPSITYRLPREAEWEYAARAGTTDEIYGSLDAIAWYQGNSGSTTHTVAGKQANAWGLYDMIGNVMEWVGDWFGLYESASVTDPTGPTTGNASVLRGGSWIFGASNARAAHRLSIEKAYSSVQGFGFRLVRSPAVASVTVAPSAASVMVGTTQQFTATLKDAGDAMLTDRSVLWSSSNTNVVTVDGTSGLATGVAAGTAAITATSEGKSAQANVTVTAPPATAYRVTSSAANPVVGTSITITAQTVNSQGAAVAIGGRMVTWSKNTASGSLGSVASVTNSAGLATVTLGVATTVATYTVSATDNTAITGASDPIVAVAAAPVRIAFVTQPSNSGYMVTITPAPQVAVQDQYGNPVKTATDQITLTLSANPGGATLRTDPVQVIDGVVTFTVAALDKAGQGYTLLATPSTTSLGTVSSIPFNVASVGTVTTLASTLVQDLAIGEYCRPVCKADEIYFTDVAPGQVPRTPGALKHVRTLGGDVTTLAASLAYPQRVLTFGSYMWYESGDGQTGAGTISKVAYYGGTVEAIASGLTFSLGGLAPQFETDSAGYMFFVAVPASGTGLAIRRVYAGGGAITDLVSVPAGGSPCFALKGGFLYYHTGNTISRVPSAGGTPELLTPSYDVHVGQCASSGPQLIVVGPTIYWYDIVRNEIRSVPTTGGAITTRASVNASAGVVALTSDGTSLYIISGSPYAPEGLVRYSLADFSKTVLSTDVSYGDAHLLVIDAANVYWVNAAGNAILKAAK